MKSQSTIGKTFFNKKNRVYQYGVLIVVLLLIVVSITFGAPPTRQLSELPGNDYGSDTIYTMIRNSNGKYWSATGANLQAAIDDIGSDGGTVWVGSDVTLTQEISLTENNIIIDFNNHKVTLGADISFVNVTDCVLNSGIKNVRITPSASATKSMIVLYIAPEGRWAERLFHNTFENFYITPTSGDNHNYTAIHLNIDSEGTSLDDIACIYGNTFRNFYVGYSKTVIQLDCTSGGSYNAWGNGNVFQDIVTWGYENGVVFDSSDSGNGFNRNVFSNIKLQSLDYSKNGFKDISNSGNVFDNCVVWDISNADAYEYTYSIDSSAHGTQIHTHISDIIDSDRNSRFIDNGDKTSIVSSDGSFYDRSPYDYIVYQNSTHTFVEDTSTGLIAFSNTDSRLALKNALQSSFFDDIVPSSILLKKGTYVFDQQLSDSNLKDFLLVGEGIETVIQAETGHTYGSGLLGIYESGNNITIRDIAFDGNHLQGSGIRIAKDNNKSGVTIENCFFYNYDYSSSSGIVIDALAGKVYSNITIRGCKFYNSYYGVWFDVSSGSICKNFDISDNYFMNNTCGIRLEYCNNGTITNNHISGGTYGIRLIGNVIDCIVQGNIITDATNGIVESDGSDYNIVALNNCRHCTTPINLDGAHTVNTTNIGIIS